MSTINRIGLWLIGASILSCIISVIVTSLSAVRGTTDLKLALWWTYASLAVLVIGIFMAQYKPYDTLNEWNT